MVNESVDKEYILSLIKEIAYKMRCPEDIKAIALHPDNKNSNPTFPIHYWDDLSIANGYPGALLLLTSLDQLFPKENWDAIVHVYILKIKESIEIHGIHQLSLYGGLAGICFALQQASKLGTRYQKLIKICNSTLIKNVEEQIFPIIKSNLENLQPSAMALYDVIQGITGIGVYALTNISLCQSFIEEIIKFLIAITKPIQAEGNMVPGWYLPSHEQFLETERKHFPQGNFNLGLAHGIPGIMGFLSIALLKGIEIKGQREAIEEIAEWIKSHRKQDKGNYFWETTVSFENEISRKEDGAVFNGRDAWCYGTPGVARSLFIAGKALKNDVLKQYALASFFSVFDRNHQQWHLPGPSFCHGISGLLTITWQMALDTQNLDLKRHSYILKDLLLGYYNNEHPLGFKDFSVCLDGKYAQINRVGLLEGVTGVLLSLLSLYGLNNWWHAPFLIGEGNHTDERLV